MLIIPAIDLRGGRCVRLTRGRKEDVRVYNSDPIAVAADFESQGAEMLHVVDLDAAFAEPTSRNREILCGIIGAVSIPVQFGGGLRDVAAVGRAIDLGVRRAVVGTVAVESTELLSQMLERFGQAAIVVGIDAKRGMVATRGWENESAVEALTLAQRVAALGVDRIVFTDIQRDGMLTGPNVELTNLIAKETGLKVTASGGVSSVADLLKLKASNESGVDSVIVGKAFYEGRFTLSEALTALQ